MKNSIAISVDNVSKTFKIPHEKISTLRGAFVSALREKSYEKFSALKNVSFEVKKGEFFGIIGRNGSGKSTLLKILAGIYTADKGTIQIDGLISPFLELGIGFNPELSGRDNIYLNASVLGLTKKEIDDKYNDIVAFSELKRFIDQKVKNYSSGMQVRLAFSVAIHANRDILLMDEVLAVGDTNFQSKCLTLFNELRASGKTIILVTHDTTYVEEYCDKALLLNEGKIISSGNPKKVINKYAEINATNENSRLEIENEKKKKEISENSKKSNLTKEESKKDNVIFGRYGNKKARILEYSIFDQEGKKTYTLETGKMFVAKFKIKFYQKIKKPAFGIMFRKNPHENLFGIHNLHRKKPLVIDYINKNCILEVEIASKVNLYPGIYYVTIACASQESFTKYELLDSMENIINVNIIGHKKFWGMVNSEDAKITIKKIK